jgi:hypothetical protein
MAWNDRGGRWCTWWSEGRWCTSRRRARWPNAEAVMRRPAGDGQNPGVRPPTSGLAPPRRWQLRSAGQQSRELAAAVRSASCSGPLPFSTKATPKINRIARRSFHFDRHSTHGLADGAIIFGRRLRTVDRNRSRSAKPAGLAPRPTPWRNTAHGLHHPQRWCRRAVVTGGGGEHRPDLSPARLVPSCDAHPACRPGSQRLAGHYLLVAGFLLCLLRTHERFVGDAELPLRRVDFITLRAERPHFFILWACEAMAPPAPFYIASRGGSMLAEVA